MEKKVRKNKLPQTDSIRELAAFWDEHDLTDFEREPEEVKAPVFVRDSSIHIQLKPEESRQIERIAKTSGLSRRELVHQWVAKELERRSRRRRVSA